MPIRRDDGGITSGGLANVFGLGQRAEELDETETESGGDDAEGTSGRLRAASLPVVHRPMRTPASLAKGTLSQPPIRAPRPDTITETQGVPVLPEGETVGQVEISGQTRNPGRYTIVMGKRQRKRPQRWRVHPWWRRAILKEMERRGMVPYNVAQALGRAATAQAVYDVLDGTSDYSSLVPRMATFFVIDHEYPPSHAEVMKLVDSICDAAEDVDAELAQILGLLRKHLEQLKRGNVAASKPPKA